MGTYSAKQKKSNVSIIGGKEIAKRLRNMEDAASGILMKAAMKGGEIALDDARKKCPVDSGRLRNSLKLEELSSTPRKATVKVDYDKGIKYGAFVELGASGRKANPFMRNAVDENIDKINDAVTNTLVKAVVRRW